MGQLLCMSVLQSDKGKIIFTNQGEIKFTNYVNLP